MNRTESVWEIHHGRGNEEKKNKMEDVPDEKNATTKKSQCFWLSILRKWNKHISLHFYSIFFILVEAGYLARPSHQATHECTGHAGFTFYISHPRERGNVGEINQDFYYAILQISHDFCILHRNLLLCVSA